ncbi:restriction endonuclease subunit S [Streptococcus bovimastitidis]|uniref:Restriction endonuclease subunit S n=1 Tax=Streptococcus bovimastitidis TaxID=1856638 RepID=A0A1L8MNR9_9STRE|nr:restriction endonuclease subunit S [Streptococcus bovimastitidis]OJF72393.1 restriction endonuclease subunit S [Streptococcus bovimastitidis]
MDELLGTYLNNKQEKVILGEVVECFKGKAVSSKVEAGDFALINLSDMTPTGIAYDQLRTFYLERRQLLRYLLEDGDVLIASKGTVKKICVFHKQDRDVVASSNITVIRPLSKLRGYYIKFFLDSAIGQRLLDQADHGKDVINLSTKELLEIPLPLIPLVKQDYMINHYLRGLSEYQRKLQRAEQEWKNLQKEIEKTLQG